MVVGWVNNINMPFSFIVFLLLSYYMDPLPQGRLVNTYLLFENVKCGRSFEATIFEKLTENNGSFRYFKN